MNEFDYEDGCPRCGDTGCDDCLDPDYDREERDFINGICRECEEWGAFQCRVHGDVYIEQQRIEHEMWCLAAAARRGHHTKAGRKARRRLWARTVH